MCVFSDKKCCGLAAFFSSPVSHWNAKDQNALHCLQRFWRRVRGRREGAELLVLGAAEALHGFGHAGRRLEDL